MSQPSTSRRLLRRPSVLAMVCLSNAEMHRRIKAGTFPAPLKIGKRAVAWTESSISEWLDTLQMEKK